MMRWRRAISVLTFAGVLVMGAGACSEDDDAEQSPNTTTLGPGTTGGRTEETGTGGVTGQGDTGGGSAGETTNGAGTTTAGGTGSTGPTTGMPTGTSIAP